MTGRVVSLACLPPSFASAGRMKASCRRSPRGSCANRLEALRNSAFATSSQPIRASQPGLCLIAWRRLEDQMASQDRIVRIGGASGFWGDSMVGAPQLVNSGLIDYLVFDYLAETTMAILAAARLRRPELGYATDFVDIAMKEVLPEVMTRGIKVVANAGGINPQGCAEALKALADSLGLSPRIAVVEGDDVSALMPALRRE